MIPLSSEDELVELLHPAIITINDSVKAILINSFFICTSLS